MATVLFLIHLPYDEKSSAKVDPFVLQEKIKSDEANEQKLAKEKNSNGGEGSKDKEDLDFENVDSMQHERTTSIIVTNEDGDTVQKQEAIKVENEPVKENLKVVVDVPAENQKKRKISKKQLNRYLSYDMIQIAMTILKDNNVKRDAWQKTDDGEFWQITFPLESRYADDLLNKFLIAGIGNNSFSSISILPITVNFPAMLIGQEDDQTDNKDDTPKKDQFFQSVKSRLTVAQVIDVVRSGTQLTFDYIMLIIAASLIAAVGLVENSSVLLVASMLVSPLMGPILGGTFGIVLRYKTLWKPGILHELLGLAICLVAGFIFGLFCGFVIPGWGIVTQEMLSRGQPRSLYVGVVVAIPSGAGVALSILGGNAGSLVGVAISASLLPPAVNAGICWAYAIVSASKNDIILANSTLTRTKAEHFPPSELAEIGAISMTLTIVNIFVIFLMGVLILKVKEVAPHTGTAVTKLFWKRDLKETRECLSGHAMNKSLGDELLNEFSMMSGMDFSNTDTLKKSDIGAKRASEFTRVLETLRNDPSYNAINSRLPGKSSEFEWKVLMKKLQPEPTQARFGVKKIYNLGATTFHSNSRFMINKLNEEDNISMAGIDNIQDSKNDVKKQLLSEV